MGVWAKEAVQAHLENPGSAGVLGSCGKSGYEHLIKALIKDLKAGRTC